jgi:hypothetical protein
MLMADKPELRAFTVNQYGSGQNRSTRWTEIGAAWRTQKGHLRIQLEAVPVNGQIILLPPKGEGDEPNDESAGDVSDPSGAEAE